MVTSTEGNVEAREYVSLYGESVRLGGSMEGEAVAEDDKKQDPKEEEVVRSPLQVAIRVFLALLVIALLVGFILAIVLRPDEVLEPETGTAPTALAEASRG